MSNNTIPLKKKIALKLHSRYVANEKKLHRLNYIFWECTLRCNLSCIHCGSDCKRDANIQDMPADDFFRALEQALPIIEPEKTMIALTGGEPLMRKDLEEIGRRLYSNRFPWGIVSNGLLLNRSRFESLLNAGLRSITISLDGLKESHTWMRGHTASFDNALNAVKMLPLAPNLKYDVATCVNNKNFHELEEIKNLLVKMGITNWRLFTVFPIGRAAGIDDLQLSNEQFIGLMDFIKKTRSEGIIRTNYGCEGFLGKYEGEVRDNFYFCRAGINIASVLADGSISACPSVRYNFNQGNIYKDNFADVWENRFNVFRDRSWTKKGICADCSSYKYCEGNGMHLHEGTEGELLFCHLKRLKD